MAQSKGVKFNPIALKGRWGFGYALDEHTVSSVPNEFGGFDTVRTHIGQLVYELKYAGKKANARKIAFLMRNWVRRKYKHHEIDCIVAIPASATRQFQPVQQIAKKLSEMMSVENYSKELQKVKVTKPLKSVLDPTARRKELSGAFQASDRFKKKAVLIVDDLYRSGETASEVARTLRTAGARKILYIAATKTRVNR